MVVSQLPSNRARRVRLTHPDSICVYPRLKISTSHNRREKSQGRSNQENRKTLSYQPTQPLSLLSFIIVSPHACHARHDTLTMNRPALVLTAAQPIPCLFPCMHAQKIDKKRVVSQEEGQRWAEDHGSLYFETSACSGANVGAVFSKLFEKALSTTDGS